MARPLTLSNGSLHVGINNFGLVHDFYYPYVGLENHSAGRDPRHKIGVWVDGVISWLDDGSWQTTFRLNDKALIGHTRALNEGIGVLLEFNDFVDSEVDAFCRNIHVVNLSDREREIRLFLHQAFVIGDTRSNTDTAQYLPDSHAILHYHGRRVIVASLSDDHGNTFDQYSIGLFSIEGHEGTWRDAEDGELSNNPVEHGRVDSTMRLCMKIAAHDSRRAHYWLTCGQSQRDAISLARELSDKGVYLCQERTTYFWHNWLKPALVTANTIPEQYRREFLHSVLTIKSHIDKRGAVIASTDTAMLHYSRDAYAYCWPRDAAYAIWPLLRLGYTDEILAFFEFCKQGLHPSGYLHHKYRADGAIGSSWHPYMHAGGETAPPIQEDETALVLLLFAEYCQSEPAQETLDTYYDSLVVPMARFLASYVSPTTNLPRSSYDLWEEKFLSSTYTIAVVQAALREAAQLAERRHDANNAVHWTAVADDMQLAAVKYLVSDEGILYKGIREHANGSYTIDDTLDSSSFYGAFMFGLFSPEAIDISETYKALSDEFGEQVGWSRYANDRYLHSADDGKTNPWIITSLWAAQYELFRGEADKTNATLDWVQSVAASTGMLPEQLSDPPSVSPLVWSHAEFVTTLLDCVESQKL